MVPVPKPGQTRSDAITLLAVLQREARFIDFIKEPITSYSDAQIGAAVRDVHQGCAGTLDRMFGLEPLAPAPEGAQVEIPSGYDPVQYRLSGNIAGEPPYPGTLRHPGWKATRCELPAWTGNETVSMVVAAAEVEVK